MQICSNKHDPIVFDHNKCPLCSLTVHTDVVHDFIESKGDALVRELVAFQHKRNSENLGNQQIQCGETPRQQLKASIALLNRWMDNPESDHILGDTYHFVTNIATAAV
jgi:hypothetical protein